MAYSHGTRHHAKLAASQAASRYHSSVPVSFPPSRYHSLNYNVGGRSPLPRTAFASNSHIESPAIPQ